MYSSAAVLNQQVVTLRAALLEATHPVIKRELLAKLGKVEAQALVAERDAFLEQKSQQRARNVASHQVMLGRVKHLFVSADQQMLTGA